VNVDIAWIVGLAAAAIHILGIFTALHAVMHARTAQGATAWAVSLLSLPEVTLPLYWMFGRSKFQGYVKARRAGGGTVEQILKSYRERFTSPAILTEDDRGYAQVLERLGRFPFSGYNRTRLLVDGEATFDAVFRGIERARDYILLQFFIIRDDRLGRELQELLLRKAGEGVRILLLYDNIGSRSLPEAYLDRLRQAGVRVSVFKSTRGRGNRFQINFRNHRKIVIVDGRLALVGGLNVGDEYMGRNSAFGRWRDTFIEVEGPSVQFVQIAFVEDWYWANRKVPRLEWEAKKASGGSRNVLVLPTGPADRIETCALFFSETINRARRRVWIASPYFVPDSQIMTSLQLAAMRGVDVRIMLPGKPDHLLVYLSSFSFIEQVGPSGVKFFRYGGGFLHQKVILADNHIAGVGTANLDNRSFRLNFEITMVVLDREFNAEVAAMMEEDFRLCRAVGAEEYARRPFWFKMAVQASRLLAPIQ
jgi:cardiolipin synthase